MGRSSKISCDWCGKLVEGWDISLPAAWVVGKFPDPDNGGNGLKDMDFCSSDHEKKYAEARVAVHLKGLKEYAKSFYAGMRNAVENSK